MSLKYLNKKSLQLIILFVLLAFSQIIYAQECPAPFDPQVVYDPYGGNEWESYAYWSMPSAECPILGFNVEFANYNFTPGTGNEQGSLSTSSTNVVIPLTPSPLYVYIQTVCAPPCGTGGTGGGDGNGGSNWILATVFVAPPPPPPPPDGSGDCSDASPPVTVGTDCVDLYNPFYDIYYEEYDYLFTTNPCTGADEYMIWNQFISPPTGQITLTGNVTDFGGFGGGPSYDSFGFVVFTGGCEGEMLLCDSTVSVDDTLSFTVPAGEVFIVGTWFNDIEFEFWDSLEGVEFDLTVCEPEPDCMYPTDISVSENTDQSVLIEWDDSVGSAWIMEYGPEGFTPGTGTELLIDSEAPYLLDGLQSNTLYDFYLYNECDAHGSNSLIIGPTSFETHPSITLINPIANGQLYCCDEIVLPETAEVEAFCDSIYFTHSDSLVGSACPYTIYRTITVHDTCGNSIQTAFHYDISDNQIPCGCEAEFVVPQDSDEIQVALHGDWAVLSNGSINEIYHLEDGAWVAYDTINNTNSYFIHSLGIYEDVIVESNHVYRLTDGTWNFETILEPSISGENTTTSVVTVHENTIAYRLNAMIFIFEYADGEWSEVAVFDQYASKLDLGENVLLAAAEFDDNIGRIYRKTEGTWFMEQELPNFHPDNNGHSLGRDAAIDGNFAAIGYKWGGGLFTFKYNGESWEPDEFLTNPYQVNPGGGYSTSFGSAVDIDGDLMVVGDYFNAVNDNFSGSIAVFERSCDQWLPQRNIVPSNGEERQRFGGCLSLQGSRMAVGVDSQYWLGGITYEGIGHYWFYECLESNPTYSLSVNDDLSVECLEDVPPAELAYELGNAWCSSTDVSIAADTAGTGCNLTITRVFTVTDSLGNSASATQLITVLDNQSPEVIIAPADLVVSCIEDVDSDEPVFTDNCTDELQITYSADTIGTTCIESITQLWIATDDCGNSTSVLRTISVSNETPMVQYAPENIQVACIEEIEIDEAIFSGNCSDSLVVVFQSDTIGDGCNFEIEQTWTAYDGCENSTTTSRTITLDVDPPAIIYSPENITVTCVEDIESDEPVFSNNCPDTLVVIFESDTVGDECSFLIEQTWTALNNCGNSISTSRTIAVEIEPPVIVSAPEDEYFSCEEEVNIEIEDPVFSSTCGGNVEVISSIDTLGGECTTIIEYQWIATNECGNQTEHLKTITFSDETPPEELISPQDLTISCNETFTVETPEFTDNCSDDVQIVLSVDTLINDACTTSISYTWEATDDCGNSTTTQKTVTLLDEESPTLICPDDFTVTISSQEDSYILVNLLDEVISADNCGDVNLTQSIAPGTPLSAGSHSIPIIASDGCQSLTCFVDIEVTISTGIDSPGEMTVFIYPNPSNGEVNIELPKAGFSTIQLFDMAGKTLLTKEMNTQLITLDLGYLSSGVYTLLVHTEDYRVVKKLVLK